MVQGGPEAFAGRLVDLEGGRNFRDLGGYPGFEGRTVRWGQLFRCGSPVGLTARDWALLNGKGIKAVCDRRTVRERAREPVEWPGEARVSYWAGEFAASFAESRDSMADGFPSSEDARTGMPAGLQAAPLRPCVRLPTALFLPQGGRYSAGAQLHVRQGSHRPWRRADPVGARCAKRRRGKRLRTHEQCSCWPDRAGKQAGGASFPAGTGCCRGDRKG